MDFEAYTERARGFVQAAQALALRGNHQRFTPEHVLKVLLDDNEGLAANLIRAAGGDPAAARHGVGPRSFGPHAFTGDRSVWGTFEHRMFLVDDFLRFIGLGFAAFLDYGGAWFDGDDPRFGGNVGFGLRTGATRASGANIGRIDFAYRFGDGRRGGRWVLSTGRGFAF